MGPNDRSEPWTGGYVRTTETGVRVYVIHKRIDGELYEKSTKRSTEIEALKEWERFKADPAKYKADPPLQPAPTVRTPSGPTPIYLTPELIDRHMKWADDEGKIKSRLWPMHKRAHLKTWMQKLHGVNLRRLPKGIVPHAPPSLEGCDLGLHIIGALEGISRGTRVKLIATIKSLYTWLRTVEFKIEPEEDPLFGRLKNEKTQKAQKFGVRAKVNSIPDTFKVIDYWRKAPIRVNQHAALAARIGPNGRENGHGWKADVLAFHLCVPWHFEEILRFMDPAEEDSRVVEQDDPMWQAEWNERGVAAVVTARGKREPVARFKVSARALEIAKRLRAYGKVGDPEHFRRELNAACEAVGVKRIYVGRFRHTHLTRGKNAGVDDKTLQDAAHHASTAQTAVYTETAVPKRIPMPI